MFSPFELQWSHQFKQVSSLNVENCLLIQMEVSWWERPGMQKLQRLPSGWGASVHRALWNYHQHQSMAPRDATAEFSPERTRTTPSQSFPCSSRSTQEPAQQPTAILCWVDEEGSRVQSRRAQHLLNSYVFFWVDIRTIFLQFKN